MSATRPKARCEPPISSPAVIEKSPQGIPASLRVKGEDVPVTVELSTVVDVSDSRKMLEGRLWAYDTDLIPLPDGSELDLLFEDGRVERIVLTGWCMEIGEGEVRRASFTFMHKVHSISLDDFP
jgi:hypothetical protein